MCGNEERVGGRRENELLGRRMSHGHFHRISTRTTIPPPQYLRGLALWIALDELAGDANEQANGKRRAQTGFGETRDQLRDALPIVATNAVQQACQGGKRIGREV